jgi:hypothetical protein
MLKLIKELNHRLIVDFGVKEDEVSDPPVQPAQE